MPVGNYIEQLRQKVGHDYLLLPGVTALIFNDAGEILLGQRSDNGRWAVIGGAVDPGETPAQAIAREVREEVGIEITIERVSGVYTTPVITYPNGDVSQYVTIGFRCRIASGTPHVADEESLDVRFFAPGALPPDVSPNHLQRIRDAAKPGENVPAAFA